MFAFQVPGLAERFFRGRDEVSIRKLFMSAAINTQVFETMDFSAYLSLLSDPSFGGINYYRAGIRGALPTLRPVHAPAQIIWGLGDPALGAHIASEEAYADWTSSIVVHRIESAGHWVQQEAPDIVNQHLIEFWRANA